MKTGTRKFTGFLVSMAVFIVIALIKDYDVLSLAGAISSINATFFVANAAVHIAGKAENVGK